MKHGLPLVTLYLTERCNSRCVTCDYWRHGRRDVTLESVQRLLPELEGLGTRTALISGGEPLLNPAWPGIAALLRNAGLELWLLTSGLSLAKHARRAAPLFERVPRVLAALARAEHSLQRWHVGGAFADHYCFEARRQFV